MAVTNDVILRTNGPSRTKGFVSLLEKSTLGVIQPKTKKDLYHAAIQNGENFKYSRDLKGHFSCVNAINFSNGDARMLVSGGDDKRVLVWDVYGDIENTKPKKCFKGDHQDNIFCTVFDSANRHILSCGNDRLILYHDLEHERTSRFFIGHEEAVQSVAFDPFNDNLFLSASQDGTVKLWDVRCNIRCQGEIGALSRYTQMTHVQYNPTVERQFVTCNNDGDIVLWDTRTAFKSDETDSSTSSSKNALMKYVTTLTRNSSNAKPDISSVTFNPSGNMLCAVINHFRPTLYNVFDEMPLCTFSSNYDPSTQTGFKNDCTFKQGSFGGPNGDYFLCGSDDFRVYVWKVPDMETMTNERLLREDLDEPDGKIRFIHDCTMIDPLENSTPQYVLNGHRSIVNSAIWHPHVPLIFSSGVEKIVKVHSTFPFSNEDYKAKITQPRLRFRGGMINLHPTAGPEENTEEDFLTLKFFDLMLDTDEYYDPYWGNDDSDESDDSTGSLNSDCYMHDSNDELGYSDDDDELVEYSDVDYELGYSDDDYDYEIGYSDNYDYEIGDVDVDVDDGEGLSVCYDTSSDEESTGRYDVSSESNAEMDTSDTDYMNQLYGLFAVDSDQVNGEESDYNSL